MDLQITKDEQEPEKSVTKIGSNEKISNKNPPEFSLESNLKYLKANWDPMNNLEWDNAKPEFTTMNRIRRYYSIIIRFVFLNKSILVNFN